MKKHIFTLITISILAFATIGHSETKYDTILGKLREKVDTTEVGLENVENIKNKFDATTDPTANDDSDDGYEVGSRWSNVTGDNEFVCLDATIANAVWKKTTHSFEELNITTIGPTGATADYVCDGTDDNLTFDTAIAAMSSGEELRILNGGYNFSAAVTITKSISLNGLDKDQTTITSIGNIRTFDLNAENIILTGIGFDNSGMTADVDYVRVQDNAIIIRSCKFVDGKFGVRLYSCQGILIEQCLFGDIGGANYQKTAIYAEDSSSNVVISNNIMSGCSDAAILLAGNYPLRYSLIEGNYIWGKYGIRHIDATDAYATNDLKILANHLLCTNVGIEFDDFDHSVSGTTGSENIIISKNTFEENWFDTGDATCILLKGTINSSIEGNSMMDCGSYLIRFATGTYGTHTTYTIINDNVGDASNGTYAFSEADANQNYNYLLGNRFVAGGSGTYDINGANSENRDAHFSDTSNPHSVTKAQVGLTNVEDTALSTWAGTTNITTLGTVTTGTISTGAALADVTMSLGSDADSDMYYRASNKLARLAKGTGLQYLRMNSGATAPEWDSLTNADVGLGNVENTALSTWAGTANITTVGTIGTGTWQGTAIDHERGGLEADVSAYAGLVHISGGATSAKTIGIADDNILEVDDATAADNDYAKFTANGLEGRTYSEVKTDLSLNNVENTALSTWVGTANITTLGTIGTGVWNGTDIAVADGGTGASNASAARVNLAVDVESLPFRIDGNGFTITTGTKGDIIVPFACTITGWDIFNKGRTDATDAIQIDLWECTYAEYDDGATHPVNGDSIIGGSEIKIIAGASNYKNQATGLSISLSAGQILRINVDSVVNVSDCSIILYLSRD